MDTPVKLTRLPRPTRQTRLTRGRMLLALAIAIAADGSQLFLGPFGFVGVDQAIDVVAMALTIWAVGFHLLLLPTFALELIPFVDALPTWTACVAAVIVLRKRAERAAEGLEINVPAPDNSGSQVPPRLYR